MRYAKLGFHIVMLILLVMTFAGAFSPPRTGNFAQDNGGSIFPVIGIFGVSVTGAVVLRIVGGFAK